MKNDSVDSDLIIKCIGLNVEGVSLPPFDLIRGEYFIFNISPWNYDVHKEKILKKFLTIHGTTSSIFIHKRVTELTDEYQEDFFEKLSTGKTVKEFLAKITSYSPADLVQVIKKCGIHPDDKMRNQGKNERKLLSIELAYLCSDCILIDLRGHDKIGIDRIYQKLKENLHLCSVIEMNYFKNSVRDNFKGSKTINVNLHS